MHLKLKTNKELLNASYKPTTNMASSLLNDDEDNATRNTQQQQQTNNNNSSNLNESSSNSATNNSNTNKMQDNEAKLKKQNLEQRKQELEKLLNEKSWLLQQLQKQESQILNGNFEYLNFNDFIQTLALQYKQEQNASTTGVSTDGVSSGSGVSNQLTIGEEAVLRRKPLAAKENQQQLNNNNALHRRQSEISNRSSEYDNYPQNDNQSTHIEGSRGIIMHGAAQATQQYAPKAALKKRSATVAGTTAHSSSNLQMIRQQHFEQQQQLLYKQQQQQQQHLQHYHHPQQHLFKQHIEHHQVLMPHLQYATQKFYYTTLQPQPTTSIQQQQSQQQHQQHQQAQQQYGRYIQSKQIAQQQTSLHHAQTTQNILPQQHLLLTPTSSGASITVDNISLYSLNSNNVATLHRPAQQQQPIIVQCDKYYLSPTSHHVSQNDGGGFIKSSQNIKEYISPHNSPQHLSHRDKNRTQTLQSNLAQRATPALDIISLAPSYVSMETIDYSTSPVASNMRWRSQTNLPPLQAAATQGGEEKSQSSDMLNNNQYYNSALSPPPPPTQTQTLVPPPNVTQVKPFKPLDEVSINSYNTETQKKVKPKQWLESSLDGPAIRQTPLNEDLISSSSSFNSTNNNNNNSSQPKAKLSSQSLNTSSRHYSMSAAQTKSKQNPNPSISNTSNNKLSQSTSYLNQIDYPNINANNPATTPSISQAYNIDFSPHATTAYKYLTGQQLKAPARPPPSALYVNTSNANINVSNTPTPPMASALSPDIRIESPVNMTVVQPATFQPYKEVTKPFEMSDFYKYSTKFRQKENNNNNNNMSNDN